MGALDGVRALELGTLIAGPFAGRLMADMGADVIKVEAPDRPDPLRSWGQAAGHNQYFWTVHARNKRCVTLDLRTTTGRDLLLELVARSDAVVESFRPGTLERWGLGYDVLATANPGVVLARVSGYGQTGPWAERPGYASVAEAISGMRHLNGYPGQAPPRAALSLGDSLAGMFAYQGILAALLERRTTGRGQVVDTALTEACLAVSESTVPDYLQTGHVRQPSGTRLDRIAPSNLYRSADDLWVIIAANQDTVFRRLAGVMERPELADDVRFRDHTARGDHQDELDALIADWAGTLSATELIDRCTAAGVVAGPVNTVAEVVEEPQLVARGMFVEHPDVSGDGEPVVGVGVVPRLTRTPGEVRWAGPRAPGSHNKEVYGDLLGLDATAIADLESAGGDLMPAVDIREVGPRDGLQIEDPIDTAAKATLLAALVATGVRRIEATAFVSPRAVPAMADAEAVAALLGRWPGVSFSALVAGPGGARRAVAAGIDRVEYVVSASESHSRANTRRTSQESVALTSEVADIVHAAGGTLEVIVAVAWDCPFDGRTPVERTVDVAREARRRGADSLCLGDTIGTTTPGRTIELVERVGEAAPGVSLGAHFHDTRGTGLASAWAAWTAGVTQLDASVGGLGGCPFAPGASGNIATEELVHLFEDSGIDTGIDLAAALDAAALVADLVGHPTPSRLLTAGGPSQPRGPSAAGNVSASDAR